MRQFEKAKDDPKNQCPSILSNGAQCPDKVVPGASHCARHGGNLELKRIGKENLRRYRLAVWNQRLAEKADDPLIKSLRDEVGILRMTLEARLNQCKDDTDLLLHSGPISDMVDKISVVVERCDKIETKLGKTLDEQQAMLLIEQILVIIERHVDPEIMEKIAGDVKLILEEKDEHSKL